MRKGKEISIGDKIGVVTVIDKVFCTDSKKWQYICKCRCGNVFKTRRDHLMTPRKGCRACLNKVKSDMNLANTITLEEFNAALKLKQEKSEAIKKQKQEEKDRKRKVREKERQRIRKEIEEKKKKYQEHFLISPVWIGEKYGRLTVIDSYIEDRKTIWVLQCDCGNVIERQAKLVKFGHCISCGCISREISENAHSKERLYGIWNGIKERCLNPKSMGYHNYGGRGIKICDEWLHSYDNFKNWAIANGWREETGKTRRDTLSIERINVNGNYEPANCCFIPMWQQCLNKRPYNEREKIKTKLDKTIVEINGKRKTLREWQEFYNIKGATYNYRISIGMSMEKALSTPKFDKDEFYKTEKKPR